MTDTLTLHHHPFSRAAGVVWMLEEVGVPYELRYVDLKAGEQRTPEYRKVNPMGKIPVLIDGDVVLTEAAAIGMYLADRYALGTLSPDLSDKQRGTYYRWILFAPSVIEPGAVCKAGGWKVGVGQVGWGDFESMLATIDAALAPGPWLLGDRFTMADVVFGGTLRYMLRFKMLPESDATRRYVDRFSERPACQAADAKNAAIAKERGLV